MTANAVAGSSPADASFTVSNTGEGALSFAVGSDAAWLTVTPEDGATTGSDPVTVTVKYDTAGLAAGTYPATITVTDVNARVTRLEQAAKMMKTVARGGMPNIPGMGPMPGQKFGGGKNKKQQKKSGSRSGNPAKRAAERGSRRARRAACLRPRAQWPERRPGH